MTLLRLGRPHRPLFGSVPVPDDEDVLLARLAVATLCRGQTTLETLGPLYGTPDAFVRALRLMGVSIEGARATGPQTLRLVGLGLQRPSLEPGLLDVRHDPSLAALLLGLFAGRSSELALLVDPIVADLLGPALTGLFGAQLSPHTEGVQVVVPRHKEGFRAPGVAVDTGGLTPWIKSAHLLWGLRAESATLLTEAIASADHFERALLRVKAPLSVQGTSIELHPPRDDDALSPNHFHPVGSLPAALFLLTAALLVPGSRVVVRSVGVSPSRGDALAVLRLLGAEVGLSPLGDVEGEPVSDLTIATSFAPTRPRGRTDALLLAGESIARQGDAVLHVLPLLPLLDRDVLLADLVAARRGGAARIFTQAAGFLRAAGVAVEPREAGLYFFAQPQREISPLVVTTGGDGRLALLGTLMALSSNGVSEIDDVDCLQQIFPRLPGTLRALGAQVEVVAR